MKELKIFGRVCRYDYNFDIESDIRVMEELMLKISEPQILSYCGLDTVSIYISCDDHFICNECIHWIFDTNKERVQEETIRECLLKCAVEDEEWTKRRNAELTDVFYRRITFLPEIQNSVKEKLQEYIDDLHALLKEMNEEKQREKEELEKQKSEWKRINVFYKALPSYDGDYKDGCIDAEYISQNGETVRMVERDVFDFGVFCYPKRFERTDDMFSRDNWTESEIRLAKWLAKFGEFHGIRM